MGLLPSFIALVLHRLSASIENFTLFHRNDVIVVDSERIILKNDNIILHELPRKDGGVAVEMKYYAAGQALFVLKPISKPGKKQKIVFSSHVEHFEKLVNTFDPDFKWPPEAFV